MAVYWTENDPTRYVAPPQFTRTRHRYRGPRESYKINLEHAQMSYSIYKLFEKQKTIRERYLEIVELAEAGSDDLVVPGLDELAQRLQRLEQRIRTLEQG